MVCGTDTLSACLGGSPLAVSYPTTSCGASTTGAVLWRFMPDARCLFHTYTTSDAGVGATLVVAQGRAGTRPAPTRPWMGITPHRSPLPGARTAARQGYWCRTYEMDI